MLKPATEAVVLVHGLWMWRWTWYFYRIFLQAKGYTVYVFGYSSTGQPIEKSVMQLTALVNSRDQQTVHLVAHSMGGILSMMALPKINKTGKLMLLGSPINGSQVARKLKKRGWHKLLLRHATEPLISGVSNPTTFRHSKMLAGNLPYGVGQIIQRMQGESDGTVSVDETQADWLNHHQVIKSNHLGLLKNKQAKAITAEFLAAAE
jgi:pimeloyl-ACP methyl ester carboxylesterase